MDFAKRLPSVRPQLIYAKEATWRRMMAQHVALQWAQQCLGLQDPLALQKWG